MHLDKILHSHGRSMRRWCIYLHLPMVKINYINVGKVRKCWWGNCYQRALDLFLRMPWGATLRPSTHKTCQGCIKGTDLIPCWWGTLVVTSMVRTSVQNHPPLGCTGFRKCLRIKKNQTPMNPPCIGRWNNPLILSPYLQNQGCRFGHESRSTLVLPIFRSGSVASVGNCFRRYIA